MCIVKCREKVQVYYKVSDISDVRSYLCQIFLNSECDFNVISVEF